MQDAFGNTVLCSSTAAVHAYDRAVDSYLHALPGVSRPRRKRWRTTRDSR